MGVAADGPGDGVPEPGPPALVRVGMAVPTIMIVAVITVGVAVVLVHPVWTIDLITVRMVVRGRFPGVRMRMVVAARPSMVIG